jgi:hypothetical protein
LRDLQPGGELRLQSRINSSSNKAEVQIVLRADETFLSPLQMNMEYMVSAQPGGISEKVSFSDKDQTGEEGTNTYSFYILRGKDRVSFSKKATPLSGTVPEIELLMLGPSRERQDILLEMGKRGKKGVQDSTLVSLTLLKPESVRSLDDREIEAMGLIPHTDYRQLLMEGRAENRGIPGAKSRKIVDGFSRTFVYTVIDQFGSPLEIEGLQGRSILIPSSDNIRFAKHDPVPERLGYRKEDPDSRFFTKHIVSGRNGRIKDVMDLAYYEGSCGIATGKEVHFKQEIYLMGWYLGERDIYIEENHIRTGAWRKNPETTM